MSSHYLQFQKVAVNRVERARAKLGFHEPKHKSTASSAASTQERTQLLNSLKTCKAKPSELVERQHAKDLPLDTFVRKHEKLCRPVVIQGLLDEWKAAENWSLYNLVSKHSDCEFTVGRDHDLNKVRIKMKYFAYYLKEYREPAPFQISDDLRDADKRRLREDYDVPSYFKDDMFKYAREADLPPTRCFNLGPPLAGDRMQTNPLQCNLWSAVVHGARRWCLFPHHVPQDLLCNDHKTRKDRRLESAVAWFDKIYPKTQCPRWPRYFKPLEIVQASGDVVFVPAGWWYVAINLDVCVAMSHHHCSPSKLAHVWPRLVRNHEKLERNWYELLRRRRPDVAVLVPPRRTRRSSESYTDSRSKTVDTMTSCTTDFDRDGSDEMFSDNS